MSNNLKDRDIAIIGYAETKIARRSGRSTYDLAGEATAKVLEYTGVGLDGDQEPVFDEVRRNALDLHRDGLPLDVA